MLPRILSLFLFSASILFIPVAVLAQSASVSPPLAADQSASEEVRSFVVADVNVGDVQVAEADGVVSGTFSLLGNMGQQNRIAFAVIVKDEDGNLVHVQPIESEVTSIQQGEIKTISFSYRLPSFLSGTVTVFVQAETTDGLPLGTQKVLEKKLPEASRQPVSCAASVSEPTFACYVEKEEREVSIQYYPGSLFVPPVRKDEAITIGGTAKTISPDLPAGRYWVAIEEAETGQPTYFPFRMPGSYGQIKNAAIAAVGDSAEIQATVSVMASPVKGTVVSVTLQDAAGELCGEATATGEGLVKEVIIETACTVGIALFELRNAQGEILDSLKEPFKAQSVTVDGEMATFPTMAAAGSKKSDWGALLIIGAVLLTFLIIFVLYRLKHQNMLNVLFFVLLGAGAFVLTAPQAAAITLQADTFGSTEVAWMCTGTVNMNKATPYAPGETATLNGSVNMIGDVDSRGTGSCTISYLLNTSGTNAAFDSEPILTRQGIATVAGVPMNGSGSGNGNQSIMIPVSLVAGPHSVRSIFLQMTGNCWGGCSGGTTDQGPLPFTVASSYSPSDCEGGGWSGGLNCMAGEPVMIDCDPGERAFVDSNSTTASCAPMNPYSFTGNRTYCVADLSCSACRTGTTVQSNDVCAANCSFNADIYRVKNPSTGAYNQGWWNVTGAPGTCSGTCAGYPLSGHTMTEISSIPVCATPAPPICVLGANAWAGLTTPNFWFGGAASGLSERIKTSLCPAGQVMTGTRSWQHHNEVDEEYEEARCAPLGAGFGTPTWHEAPNAFAYMNPGDKTVMCPAGQVMVGTRMYGAFSDVDEEHIDAYCATPPAGTTIGAPVMRINGSNAVLSSAFKNTLCPANHVMVGVNWFQWPSGLDEEHTDAFCAPVTLACGPACAWEDVGYMNGFAEVQNNSRSEDVCDPTKVTWFIPNVCPGSVATGGDSSAYASGYRCYDASTKFKGFAPTYETGMCMAKAYRSVCTGAGANVFATPGAVVASVPDTWWQKLWKYLRGPHSVVQASGSASIVVNQNLDLTWNSSGVSSCTITPSPAIGLPFPLSGLSGNYTIPARTLSPGTTYTFTMSCTGASGNAGDSTAVIVAPPTDFKLCPTTPAPIAPAATSQMRAYYVTSGTVNCSNLTGAIEVTTDPSINWSSANAGIATVDNAGSKGLITAVASGTTNISATYMTSSDSESFTVSCTPTAACTDAGPAATAANTCAGSTFNINDGCSGTIVCSGTRTCDFNWKEVGQ